MATPFFPCPDAGSLWSACTFTQMLTSFTDAIKAGMTHGVIGIGLEILGVVAAFQVLFFCIWLALSDDDQFLAHLLGQGIKIAIYGQLIAQMFELAIEFGDSSIVVGIMIGATASIVWGLPPFTLAQFHDPGGILLVGWRLFTPLFDYIESIGLLEVPFYLGTILLYGIVGILGWACVLWIGINIIVGWVELMLLAAFGTPLVVFSVFEHTRFIGANVFPTIVQAALRMGMFATILSLIFPIMRSLQVTDGTDPGWDTVLALLGTNLLFGYLCWRADALAARLTGGSAAHVGMGLAFLARQTRMVGQQVSSVGLATTQALRRAA